MAAENPGGQENDRLEKLEDAVDRNSHDPKRKKEQPHDRIQNESQQRQRPAKNEKQDEEQKSGHSPVRYGRRSVKVHPALAPPPDLCSSRDKIFACRYTSIDVAAATADSRCS